MKKAISKHISIPIGTENMRRVFIGTLSNSFASLNLGNSVSLDDRGSRFQYTSIAELNVFISISYNGAFVAHIVEYCQLCLIFFCEYGAKQRTIRNFHTIPNNG